MFYVWWWWSTTGTRTAIFGHPYVEDDCGPGFFFVFNIILFVFSTFETSFLSPPFFFLFSFVQYAVYDHVFVQLCQYHLMFIAQNQPMFGSITASQTSVQIVVFFFLNLFFFSSKKEIKSAGTEKWRVCPLLGFHSFNLYFILFFRRANWVPSAGYLTVLCSTLKIEEEVNWSGCTYWHMLKLTPQPPFYLSESMLIITPQSTQDPIWCWMFTLRACVRLNMRACACPLWVGVQLQTFSINSQPLNR